MTDTTVDIGKCNFYLERGHNALLGLNFFLQHLDLYDAPRKEIIGIGVIIELIGMEIKQGIDELEKLNIDDSGLNTIIR